MIYTKDMITEITKEYNSPYSKITHMIKKGKIIRVRRGLYSDTAETPGEVFAPLVYSPSYLSFQYALAYHGLIPYAVCNFTCAGFGLEADKVFKTPFGVYVYKYIPKEVFYIEPVPFGPIITGPEASFWEFIHSYMKLSNPDLTLLRFQRIQAVFHAVKVFVRR